MDIESKIVPIRNRTGGKNLIFNTAPSSPLIVKDKCLIVGAGGAGKSSFAKHYFKNDPVILETSLHSAQHSLENLTVYKYQSHYETVKDGLWESLTHQLCRAAKSQSESQNPNFQQISYRLDERDDFLTTKIDRTSLSSTRLIGGSLTNMRLPLEYVLSRLESYTELDETFTVAEITPGKAQEILEYLYSDIIEIRKAVINSKWISSYSIANLIIFLDHASTLNPRLGFQIDKLVDTFNLKGQGSWRMTIEGPAVGGMTSEFKGLVTSREALYFYKENKKLQLGELSSTQFIQVVNIMIRATLELLDSSLRDHIVIFDEPDSFVDPSSSKKLVELFDGYSSAKWLGVTTHSIALFSELAERKDFDILKLDNEDQEGTKISNITDAPYEHREVVNRLVGGINLINFKTSVYESFFTDSRESYFIFSEGSTDSQMFKFAQDEILSERLFSDELRKFLSKTLIASFSIESGYSGYGAGNLANVFTAGLDPVVLKDGRKYAIAVFDSDDEGLKQSSRIHQGFKARCGPGELVQRNSDNIFYYNLHIPSLITHEDLNFSDGHGPETEHLFFHVWSHLDYDTSSVKKLKGKKKNKFPQRIEKEYRQRASSKAEKEEWLREVCKVFDQIRMGIP